MALQIESITPTSITATVGAVIPMSCAVSGEFKTIGNFSARPLPVSALSVYRIAENSSTGRIYVGLGYRNGEADVYYTDDQGSNYTLFSDTTSNAVHALIVRSNGDVIHTISTDSGLNGSVYLNGSVLRSGNTDAYVSLGIDKFSNGNVCIAIGNATQTVSGGILLISPTNVVTKPYSQTKRLYGLVVDSTGTVGYTTDITGRVFKTTDSGETWSQISRPVSSTTSRCVIGILPNNDVIYVNTLDNVWRISTDGGVTFSVWGNAPSASYTVYEQIRTTVNGVVFGALNSPTVCELYDDVWRYKTIGAGIDDSFAAPLIQNNKIFAGAGSGADDGDLWIADYSGAVSKTLIDTSDSSVLSTVSPYTYTADIADDNKNFRWSVTDGVTTVQSALIPVNVGLVFAFVDKPIAQSVIEGATLDLLWTVEGGLSDTYTANLKFDGSTVETITNATGIFDFSRPATMADNGNFTCEVVNGLITIQDTIAVVVGADSVAYPLAGHSCDISMSWAMTTGHNDNFYVYDMGAEYDTYTAEVEYMTDDVEYFERGTENVPIQVTNHAGGFYPFGCHVATEIDGFRYMQYKGKMDLSAKWHGFKLKLIPETDYQFTYNAYSWTCVSVTGFNFGVLINFPVPTVEGEQKENKFYNREANNVQEYDLREATEYRSVKLKWENLTSTQQSALCSYILTGVRATQISVLFPEMMAPWKPRTGETWGNFNIKLSSEVIKLKQSSGNLWSVEIEVKKCQ